MKLKHFMHELKVVLTFNKLVSNIYIVNKNNIITKMMMSAWPQTPPNEGLFMSQE